MTQCRKPLQRSRTAEGHNWAVSKTMQIHARGAIKLARKFGDALVCVRYRLSPDGAERMTTVELVVDRDTVQSKANPPVAVKIYPSESKLRAQAQAKGAWFNPQTRLWQMRQNDAHALGLAKRIARFENQK